MTMRAASPLTSFTTLTMVPTTVAGLPTGTLGVRAFVSDALAPVSLSAVAGGGAVKVPVYHNGTTWIVG